MRRRRGAANSASIAALFGPWSRGARPRIIGMKSSDLPAGITLFGIDLRRPTLNEFTAASVLALGLWLLVLGLAYRFGAGLQAFDAGALLLVVEWGCVAARAGVRPDRGARHVLANLAVSALLVGVYAASWHALA